MSTKEIENIKMLAENIPMFPTIVGRYEKCVEYKLQKGVCFSWDVEIVPEYKAGVHRWYLEPGTVFPSHSHGEAETMVVFDKYIILSASDMGEDLRIEEGQCAYISPDTLHSMEAPEGARFYTITVPAGFRMGGRSHAK